MSVLGLICGRMFRLFHSILGVFKRALCFMRKRDNIGELPFTVAVDPNVQSLSQPNCSPGYENVYPTFNSSRGNDSWDQNNSWDQKAIVEDKIEEYRRKKELENLAPEPEDEPNFFNDMVPEIKKAKKVILKSRQAPTQNRNLFAFEGDVPAPNDASNCGKLGELGELNEQTADAWEDEGLDGLLQTHKQKELEEKRRARLEDHERRNREKVNRMAMGHI